MKEGKQEVERHHCLKHVLVWKSEMWFNQVERLATIYISRTLSQQTIFFPWLV